MLTELTIQFGTKISELGSQFRIVDFRYVDDTGDLCPPENVRSVAEKVDSFEYSLGIFELEKL
jgi:hypothetical protein